MQSKRNKGAVLMTETELQKRIQVGVSPYAAVFRIPAGKYYQGQFNTMRDGTPYIHHLRRISVAVEGYPDLSGFRRSDGKAVFIEVKTKTGRVSKNQAKFIEMAKKAGCLAGVARSVEDAIKIITDD